MLLLALGPVRTEASHIVLTNIFALLQHHRRSRNVEGEIATLWALEAEAAIELGTDLVGKAMVILDELPVLVNALLRQKLMPIQALIASIAVPVFLEEFA